MDAIAQGRKTKTVPTTDPLLARDVMTTSVIAVDPGERRAPSDLFRPVTRIIGLSRPCPPVLRTVIGLEPGGSTS